MSQCYNYAGNPTDCFGQECIGTDCHADDWYGNQFGTDGVYVEETEGMYEFETQEEFNEWFLSQYSWGEPYNMFGDDDDMVPTLISEEDAEQLTNLFQQYNIWNEVQVQNEFFRDEADAARLHDLFVTNTEAALEEQELLADQNLELNIESTFIRESYENEMNKIENRDFKLALQDKLDQNKAIKAGKGLHHTTTREDEIYAQEVADVFNQYTNDTSKRKKQTLQNIDLLNTAHQWDTTIGQEQLDKEITSKELAQTLAVQGLWRNTKNEIKGFREAYEADIYKMLAQFAATGAFFDDPKEYTQTPLGFEAEPDDEGECTMNCGDGCSYSFVCQNQAVGNYSTNNNCCDWNDSWEEEVDEDYDGEYTAYCCPQWDNVSGLCVGDCCWSQGTHTGAYNGCWCKDAAGNLVHC